MGREAVERMQREAAILADYQKRMEDLRSSDIAKDPKSYEEQRKAIVAQYEWRLARESEFQAKRKAMEGDWRNGFTRAWQDIASEVNNTADQIADFTGTMFDGMTNALHSFVVNGKASFKDFTRSVLSDLAKIALQKAIVGIAGSMFGGPALQTGNPAAGGTWGFMPATFSANGNVVTPDGPMKLNYYEKGGIARSPQLSIFGEGRLPEAYVPLPDGRSIPVTMEGDVGGGGVLNNIEVNVHIDNKGNAQVNASGGQGGDARNLGQALSASVKETIAQEMRPGGILWRWRN